METMPGLTPFPEANPAFAPEVTPHQGRTLILVGLAGLLGLYLVGLDKGFLVSLVQAQLGLDPMLIHELVHDARHIAAFPCH